MAIPVTAPGLAWTVYTEIGPVEIGMPRSSPPRGGQYPEHPALVERLERVRAVRRLRREESAARGYFLTEQAARSASTAPPVRSIRPGTHDGRRGASPCLNAFAITLMAGST